MPPIQARQFLYNGNISFSSAARNLSGGPHAKC